MKCTSWQTQTRFHLSERVFELEISYIFCANVTTILGQNVREKHMVSVHQKTMQASGWSNYEALEDKLKHVNQTVFLLVLMLDSELVQLAQMTTWMSKNACQSRNVHWM